MAVKFERREMKSLDDKRGVHANLGASCKWNEYFCFCSQQSHVSKLVSFQHNTYINRHTYIYIERERHISPYNYQKSSTSNLNP